MKAEQLADVVATIRVPHPYVLESSGSLLRVKHYGPDNEHDTLIYAWWYGPWWSTKDMGVAQVERQALRAVLTYAEHETREQFTVDGIAKFANSH